jgi:hypothetical protein
MFAARLATLVCLTLLPAALHAGEERPPPAAVPDFVYKGVIGKALDALPLPAEERVALQRTNAVLSGTLSGRSLAAWAGLSNPLLMVAGFMWGVFSASHIAPAAKAHAAPARLARLDAAHTAATPAETAE